MEEVRNTPSGYFYKGDAVAELSLLQEHWQEKFQVIYLILHSLPVKTFLSSRGLVMKDGGATVIYTVPSSLFRQMG